MRSERFRPPRYGAAVRCTQVAGVLLLVLIGWAIGGAGVVGYIGAATGLVLGLALGVVHWRGLPLWSWARLYLRRNRVATLTEPVTVANDRSGGGVRCLEDAAVVAVQVLGTPHTPSVFTGSASTYTENTLDIGPLRELLHQDLDLEVNSLSVVSFGARRRNSGDYARVYDTIIGPPPYAGQRETWLIARISLLANADALRYRLTTGSAAVAAAQRISAALRRDGIRARVGTSTDIVELERKLGAAALEPGRPQWRGVRGDSGWLTTYWYRNRDVSSEVLAQAWSMQVDSVIQNITLYDDDTMSATLTVATAQPLTASPAVILRPLSGEQAEALAGNLCLAAPELRAVRRGPVPPALQIPIGPSGVLLGKVGEGDRLMIPFSEPGDFSRIHIAAEDNLIKRLLIRAAGAGDRLTVHTRDSHRWASIRMPDITVTDRPRPAPGTTVSVVDGPLAPVPRPNTVISIADPDQPPRGQVDVVINQVGPALIEVSVGGRSAVVEMELFRAENRYVSSEPMSMMSGSEFADEGR